MAVPKDTSGIVILKGGSRNPSCCNSFAGYSGTYYGDYDMSMRGPRYSYDDMSYARGRDSMGRFTSRDGYSGHDGKEGLIEKLNMAMMNARNDEDREQYRRAMEQLKR